MKQKDKQTSKEFWKPRGKGFNHLLGYSDSLLSNSSFVDYNYRVLLSSGKTTADAYAKRKNN